MLHGSISEAFLWCSKQKESWRSVFIIALWFIWKWRNNFIFNGKSAPFLDIFSNITLLCESIPQKPPKHVNQVCKEPPQGLSFMPRAFLDGAEQDDICGCGVHIIANENNHYLIPWNGGRGSNSKAGAMALAGLLSFCLFLNLQNVTIFGDSRVLVDYVFGKNNILKPQLIGWLDRIRFLWIRLAGGSIHHINRALNQQADDLSKEGLQMVPGLWSLQVADGGAVSLFFQLISWKYPS